MNPQELKQIETWAKNLLSDDFDKFDIHAEIDSALSVAENKTILREKFKVFFQEIQPTRAEIKTELEQEGYTQLQDIKTAEEEQKKSFELFVYELKKSPQIALSKFEIPKEYIKAVARGFSKGFIFSGSAGIGKTFLTRQTLAQEGVYFVESRGVSSALALYNFLYENNSKDKVLLLDDVAGLINNENAFSLLLGALWDGFISWNSTTDKLKAPRSFNFDSRIIIIANSLNGRDAEILKSRCLVYDLSLNREDKLSLMYLIAQQPHKEIRREERLKIVDFIKQHTENAAHFDLRTQQKAEQLYLYDRTKWESLVLPLIIKDDDLIILKECLNNNNSISDAEREFIKETGLSRRQFYYLRKQIN
jgi:hypothetical protein